MIKKSKDKCYQCTEKLNKFYSIFSDQKTCLDYIVKIRWPDGFLCPKCQKITKLYKIKNRNAYVCNRCKYHYYPLKGTIFERSSTPIPIWFKAASLYIISSCKITVLKLQKQLNVSYKTAWRIRKKMSQTVVDIEETATWGVVTTDGNFFGLPNKKYIGRWSVYKKKGKLEKFFDLLIEEKNIYWKFLPKKNQWVRLKKI